MHETMNIERETFMENRKPGMERSDIETSVNGDCGKEPAHSTVNGLLSLYNYGSVAYWLKKIFLPSTM